VGVIEADSARAVSVPAPRSAQTIQPGRSIGRDHGPFNRLARGDRKCDFRGLPALVRATVYERSKQHDRSSCWQKPVPPVAGKFLHSRAGKLSCFHGQAQDSQLLEKAHRIERGFQFRNFREALTLFRRLVNSREAERHHPNVSFGWGQCDGLAADQEDQGNA